MAPKGPPPAPPPRPGQRPNHTRSASLDLTKGLPLTNQTQNAQSGAVAGKRSTTVAIRDAHFRSGNRCSTTANTNYIKYIRPTMAQCPDEQFNYGRAFICIIS